MVRQKPIDRIRRSSSMLDILNTLSVRRLIILLIVAGLYGCSGDSDDLRTWVDEIKKQPPRPIDKMPQIVQYKPYDYSSAALKSPFAEIELELESELRELQEGCDESIQPDLTRIKEDLERFSLDSMEMVGILQNDQALWGLLKLTAGDSKDSVYKVEVGNYVGINHGNIVAITEEQIEVETLVPDNKGCWEKRTIYLKLAQ